jgi:hypothetical protein
VCSRTPTLPLAIRAFTGMIVVYTKSSLDGNFCREHGIQLARSHLVRTLFTGWWSFTSFFLNFGAILADLLALKLAKKLPPPA